MSESPVVPPNHTDRFERAMYGEPNQAHILGVSRVQLSLLVNYGQGKERQVTIQWNLVLSRPLK